MKNQLKKSVLLVTFGTVILFSVETMACRHYTHRCAKYHKSCCHSWKQSYHYPTCHSRYYRGCGVRYYYPVTQYPCCNGYYSNWNYGYVYTPYYSSGFYVY